MPRVANLWFRWLGGVLGAVVILGGFGWSTLVAAAVEAAGKDVHAEPGEATGPPARPALESGPPPRPLLSETPPPRPGLTGTVSGPAVPPSSPAAARLPAKEAAGPGHGGGDGGAGTGLPLGPGPGLNDPGLPFASTNLVSEVGPQLKRKAKEAEIDEARRMLATGRQQRSLKLYREATGNFVGVLNASVLVPDELKRAALLEMALVAQEQNELTRAVQVMAQFLSRWPKDAGVPEVLLRQGLIYRQLGAYAMAHSKFYATMTSALMLKEDYFDYYRRLVLQAQVEIAETLVLQGKHREAGDAFARLLRDDSPGLNRRQAQFRMIHCLAVQNRHAETVGQARDFITRHPASVEESEVRYLLVKALKAQGQTQDALQEVMKLLRLEQGRAQGNPEALAYWQQRTGNDLANQLYQEGDLLSALEVYRSLLVLSPLPSWRFPVQYQIGLVFERLEQPGRAMEAYGAILAAESELGEDSAASLKVLLDMARWRRDFLQWQMKTDVAQRVLKSSLLPDGSPSPGAAGPGGGGGPAAGGSTEPSGGASAKF